MVDENLWLNCATLNGREITFPRMKRKDQLKRRPAPKVKWTPIDPVAAKELTAGSAEPGTIFPLPLSVLPANLKPMPGVVSYYISSHRTPIGEATLTVGGEFAVIRTDGKTRKAYNYAFATSNNGQICFNGPYKHFREHHSDASEPVMYFTPLFGHTPFEE